MSLFTLVYIQFRSMPVDFYYSVCGTTGKRKACKDCSCGLAEELAVDNNEKIATNDTQKSSCGSVSKTIISIRNKF